MNTKPLISRNAPPVALTDRLESGIMPLINLVFLLLMFFLVTGVILEDQLPDLPANDASDSRQEPRVDFTIDAGGKLMQKGQVVDLQGLAALLEQSRPVAGREDVLLRLGAHQDLTMADLERVLAAFDRAGVAQVQLLTEPSQ